MMIKH